jgi:hypothetical protein
MALSPTAIRELDSLLDKISRKTWNFPVFFPKAGHHAFLEDLGLTSYRFGRHIEKQLSAHGHKSSMMKAPSV